MFVTCKDMNTHLDKGSSNSIIHAEMIFWERKGAKETPRDGV